MTGARDDMTQGIIGVVHAGDLVYLPADYFHMVITISATIWVGCGKFGNGLLLFSSLEIRMNSARLRNDGRNDNETEGWTMEEEEQFDTASMYLHKELHKLGPNRPNSDQDIRRSLEMIWRFTKFEPGSKCVENWEKMGWMKLAKSFVGERPQTCLKLWPNGCFLGDICHEGIPVRTIEEVVHHMKMVHGRERIRNMKPGGNWRKKKRVI